MNMQGIRGIAKAWGIPLGKLGKVALVRTLQHEEDNFDCFANAYSGYCDQSDCMWREGLSHSLDAAR